MRYIVIIKVVLRLLTQYSLVLLQRPNYSFGKWQS